jgi:hypothetical protein
VDRGHLPAIQHPGLQPVAAGLLDCTASQNAGAVAEDQFLAAADASHRGGVEAFVAVDDGELTGHRQRVDVEQARHANPAAV